MRRPAPQTLDDIRHPGPQAQDRMPYASCHATKIACQVSAGEPLLNSLGRWADSTGFSSAVLDLSGVQLAAFDYVMPDRAVDDRHAAWYSDTHSSKGTQLEEAVAILGWRDGTWFAHIHAYWQENAPGTSGISCRRHSRLPMMLTFPVRARWCTVRSVAGPGDRIHAVPGEARPKRDVRKDCQRAHHHPCAIYRSS
jgi:hypothetical protein